MKNIRFVSQTLGALSLVTVGALPLAAQQVAKVQLAFGYECDNKFALRNEGTQGVNVDYAVAGTTERGTVSVKANETVELESTSNNDVQLYVDGKLVATEKKGNRPCAAPATQTVTVRHLDPSTEVVYAPATTVQPVYVSPSEVVYVSPWSYGYYPYSSFSLGLDFPIFGGYYGGYGGYRGFGHGIPMRGPRGFGGHRR
ncbi:MAG: hypothetical protein HY084_13460 [Gemmatimonadetes bacterium]|nr:hypothetical protein [Gemmatimonadota bacterium]